MLLITGHKGFIGSHLTKSLNEKNIPWVGYDLREGNDIRDLNKLDWFFEEHQIMEVVHLAALAGVRRGEEYRNEYLSTNVMGTDNILKMCEKYQVSRAILFSSSSIYGEGDGKPNSFYGMTKAMGELLPYRYDIKKVFIVRPFTVYGENGRGDQVIYKWINQIKNKKPITFYGEGTSERSYTYVGDLVDGVLLLLKENAGERLSIETYDFGGKESITLRQLFNIFVEELDSFDVEYASKPKADVMKNVADISKAKRVLGYDPKANFNEKVRSIIKKEFNL